MKPQERVLNAIIHQETKCVPVDFCSTPGTGISAIAYNKLKDHLGINPGPTRIHDVIQQLAQPDDAVLDALQADVIDIGRIYNTEASAWRDTTLTDGSSAQEPAGFRIEQQPDGSRQAFAKDGTWIATMPVNGKGFIQSCFPYQHDYPVEYTEISTTMSHVMWSALPLSPWDHVDNKNFWLSLRQRIMELRAATDRALIVNCGCNLFEWASFLRHNDNLSIDLLADINKLKKLLDAVLQKHLVFLDKVCTTVGGLVDICRISDTLGMNAGPFITPDTYRHLIQPGHKILCNYVHSHSKMHTMLYSSGSIFKLIPDLIDAGFEIISPIQTTCADMDPMRLKNEFGRNITFWGGGCDTKNVLLTASPDKVKAHVLERLKIFTPQGGYIFSTENNIPAEVPPQNIMAMVAAIREFNGN